MKHRGTVFDIADPQEWGRIRVRLSGFADGADTTPWCWPCSPLAGPGYGLFCLPVVGDEVWVEQAEDGEWVWTGFFWNGRKAKPENGSGTVRVFRTPVGHQLKFDEAGDVELVHTNGSVAVIRQNTDIEISQKDSSKVILHQNGDIEVTAKKNILLNDSGSARCVNTMSICAYTGGPHPQGSDTVYSEKP